MLLLSKLRGAVLRAVSREVADLREELELSVRLLRAVEDENEALRAALVDRVLDGEAA